MLQCYCHKIDDESMRLRSFRHMAQLKLHKIIVFVWPSADSCLRLLPPARQVGTGAIGRVFHGSKWQTRTTPRMRDCISAGALGTGGCWNARPSRDRGGCLSAALRW